MGSPTQRKGGWRFAVAVGLLLAAAPPLHAQGTGTVRGTVVDATNRQPLAGASVSIVGGTARTVTSASGEYTLTGVPEGRVRVRAAMLGHQPAEASVAVAAGQTAQASFALATAAVGLEAIVVTGTPGATSRRQLPNAVTTLDVEEITSKTTVSDVTEVLQSRTPGVQILSNAGTPGAAADIRIRGAGSLTAVRPIIYVDGIRYSDAELGNFGASGAGITAFSTQVTSALSFINPEDIESIEVIKGPAASTLYGAEAAAGVIQIITKKGTRGAQQTRWSAKVEYGQNDMVSDIPDNFTACTQARIDQRDATGQPVFPGCQGVPLNTILRESSPILRDPFGLRTGDVRRMNLSVRGGSDRFSFFVAGDADDEEGVFFNSFNNRRSFRGNFTVNATSRLDFQVSTNYVRNHLRLPIGDESAQGLLLGSVRGLAGRVPAGVGVFPGYAFAVDGRRANGYNNQTRSDRTTLSSTVNYRPWSWFRNRLTVGLDLTSSQATIVSAAGSTDADFAGTPEGLSALRVPRSRFLTLDYAGNVELPVNDWLETTTSVGLQFIARRTETLSGTGTGLGAPDITTIQNAATTTGSNTFFENNSIGVYVQEQLAINNRLFITGALRADDNSSFGRDFDAIIYPKLGFSWVLSEEPGLARFLDPVHTSQLKIRAAYGQAGRAPDPYSANQTYTVVKVAGPGAVVSGLRTVAYGNPNLEPERGEEVELGFEAAFLEDRLGLDFTWYSKRTDNLLQSISVAPSSGFISTQLTNLGEISNSGLELLVTAYPVRRGDMQWESRLNLATNRNRLVRLNDEGLSSTAAAFQAYFTGLQVMRVGRPLAAFYTPVAIADSFEVRSGITFPVLDTASYLGTPTPTREIGWGNTFTLGRVSLFAQLDYKGGHKVFNYKEYDRCRLRGNCEIANDPRMVAPASAADSAFARDATRFMGRGILNSVIVSYVEPYVEDADFLKLRDLSLSFSIPERLVARTGVSGATLILAGHNVATLWTEYSGIDPEVNTYGNRSFVRVDAYAAPQNRRLSASINFNF